MITCYNTGGETGGLFGPPTPPGNVLALVSGRRINAGKTIGNGIDFTADYSFDTGSSRWNLGVVATYTLGWQVSPIPGAPLTEEVNRFGYPLSRAAAKSAGNGILASAAFCPRRSSTIAVPTRWTWPIACRRGGQLCEIRPIPRSILPSASIPATRSTSGSRTICRSSFSIQNLFDTDPPLVVNQSGLAGSAVRFDPTYGVRSGGCSRFNSARSFERPPGPTVWRRGDVGDVRRVVPAERE